MKHIFKTGDGVKLSYYAAGEGQPVVFQHGLCGDAAQPAQVFPDDIGFRRVTLECRGHGASETGPIDKLSIAAFTEDLSQLMAAKIGKRVVVGGISMGAAIALRMAVTHPDQVSALILARPAWLIEAAPENMLPNAVLGELLKRHTLLEARARFETTPLAAELATKGPDNLASLRGFFSRKDSITTSELLTCISADGPGITSDQVMAITVPTLILGHKLDYVHPLAFAQQLEHMIPNSRLVEITPKATDLHAYTTEFRAALATFLKRI